jgi:D-alanyl-D-alanine carboxypeptidase
VNWANALQLWMRPAALYLLSRFPTLIVASTYRSIDKQASLYRQWEQLRAQGYSNAQICAKGICTPAPPGQSYHNYGRAFDLNGPLPVLQAAAVLWRSMGGTWFPGDPIHFQA